MIATGAAIIKIEEGSYRITCGLPVIDNVGSGGGNGLLMVVAGRIMVRTGTFWGPLRLTLETHDSAPPVEVDGWEEVVEISAFTDDGLVRVFELFGEAPEGLPRFRIAPQSWFRIRCHARGRDEADALQDLDEVIEEHLLQLWPAPEAEEVRHRLSDRFGADERHEPPTS